MAAHMTVVVVRLFRSVSEGVSTSVEEEMSISNSLNVSGIPILSKITFLSLEEYQQTK